MQITAPVTDYIPASVLTAQGDLVVRGVANPERLAKTATPHFLGSTVGGAYPGWHNVEGTLNQYLKAAGVGTFPAISTLALRDTGIHIATVDRNAAGAQAFTGAGFRPSLLILCLTDATPANLNFSIGFTDGTHNFCMFRESGGPSTWREVTQCGHISRGGGNTLSCVLASFDADGFTLTWSLAGAIDTDGFYVLIP